jgi:hypothetical protein
MNNNGFWIRFIGTSLQLQSIITAHSQWLPNTRSIPYWTTSVSSSNVMNDERKSLPNKFMVSVLTCPPFKTL